MPIVITEKKYCQKPQRSMAAVSLFIKRIDLKRGGCHALVGYELDWQKIFQKIFSSFGALCAVRYYLFLISCI